MRASGTIDIAVCRLCRVPTLDKVGNVKCTNKRTGIVSYLFNRVVHLRHHPRREGIADFNVHLRRQVHLSADTRDTTLTKTRLREVLCAFQSYAPADEQLHVIVFYPYMVRRSFIARDVQGVLLIILIHSLT